MLPNGMKQCKQCNSDGWQRSRRQRFNVVSLSSSKSLLSWKMWEIIGPMRSDEGRRTGPCLNAGLRHPNKRKVSGYNCYLYTSRWLLVPLMSDFTHSSQSPKTYHYRSQDQCKAKPKCSLVALQQCLRTPLIIVVGICSDLGSNDSNQG